MPRNFFCDIDFKRQRVALYKIDVLVLLVTALTTLALKDFNEDTRLFRVAIAFIEVQFSSTRSPGQQGFRVKEIMWSLKQICCWFNREGYWAEVQYQSRYGGEEGRVLGYGQLISLSPPGASDLAISNATQSDITYRPNSNTTLSSPLPASRSRANATNAAITCTNFSIASHGAVFAAYDIYTIFIEMLLKMAQQPLDSFSQTLYGYNPIGDVSFALSATSRAMMEEFTNRYCSSFSFSPKCPAILDIM